MPNMDIKEIRRRRARLIKQECGSITRMAEEMGRQQTQLSALIGSHPTRNIGDQLARDIEDTFGKPRGWLDTLEVQDGLPAMTEAQAALWEKVETLTDGQTRALARFITSFLEDMQVTRSAPPHRRRTRPNAKR